MLETLQELSYQYWCAYKRQIPSCFNFNTHVSSQDVKNRIEIVISDCISQIFCCGSFSLSFLSTEKSCEYDPCSGVNRISSGKTKILKKGKSTESIAHVLKILEISYSLLDLSTKATKREVFYIAPELFKTQTKSDKAIENACALLEVPRNRLNIISAGKGFVSGDISFVEAGIETVAGNRVLKIPQDIDEVSDLKTTAQFLLIVEKETCLNRLVQEKFFDECKCIGVTGCGYPDMQTREFIRRVVDEFSWIPVLVLTDYDPHGFKILCTYTFGSAKMCGECDYLAVPFAHWIGVHCGESFTPLPLGAKDWKLLEKLLRLEQLNLIPDSYQNKRFGMWRQQLEQMINGNSKYEIESTWEGRLTEYILYKINNGSWI
jgi:meiotic recombination protein SPO11